MAERHRREFKEQVRCSRKLAAVTFTATATVQKWGNSLALRIPNAPETPTGDARVGSIANQSD